MARSCACVVLLLLLLCVEEAVMPELPEVEQARKLFVRCCSGRRIVSCKVEQVSRSKVKCGWENRRYAAECLLTTLQAGLQGV